MEPLRSLEFNNHDRMSRTNSRLELQQQVIWPAVAGNVGWSFMAILLTQFHTTEHWLWGAKWCCLVVLAIYMLDSWRDTPPDVPPGYLFWDTLFVVAIAAFATLLSHTELGMTRWPAAALLGMFAILAWGHYMNIWYGNANDRKRNVLTLVNVAAVLVVLISFWAEQVHATWLWFFALTIIMSAWFYWRGQGIEPADQPGAN